MTRMGIAIIALALIGTPIADATAQTRQEYVEYVAAAAPDYSPNVSAGYWSVGHMFLYPRASETHVRAAVQDQISPQVGGLLLFYRGSKLQGFELLKRKAFCGTSPKVSIPPATVWVELDLTPSPEACGFPAAQGLRGQATITYWR